MRCIKHISIVIFLGALFFSCSSKTKHNPLIGKWQNISVTTEKSNHFLSFTKKDDGNSFTEFGWFSDTISGKWEHLGDTLIFEYVAPNKYTVDSITIENSKENGAVTSFYENEKLVSITEEGIIQPTPNKDIALISSFSSSNLSFQLNGSNYSYQKEEEIESGVSFLSIIRGIFGLMGLLLITFIFSGKRKNIDWNLVVKGVALQIIIALLVLKVPFVEGAFQVISDKFVQLIQYTDDGVDFLFGQFGVGTVQAPLLTFAIKVLPTIIFFSALMSMLYYLGVLQKIVYVFAWVMKRFMHLSGAESLAAAGNVFLGQTESPLLVKPYLLGMTKSEMMCLMTGGMATIAGGVLAAYVNFLGGDDPVQQAFFAKHLITASIISAPAAIVAAKILIPETEEINQDLSINKEKLGANVLEAISNGTSDGLKLAVNVGAMLLVFIGLMALGNGILGWIGENTGLNDAIAAGTPYKDGLSFQFLLGYVGAPVVWLIGVEWNDIVPVGELLGQKTVLNEFIAYPRLGEMTRAGTLSEKSIIISTYMLCGFANFASIGIQIGGIGSLVPSRKGLLSKLGMKALLGGTIASLMTAAIVGMFY